MDTEPVQETTNMPPTPPSRKQALEDRLLDLIDTQFQGLRQEMRDGDDRVILALKENADERRRSSASQERQQAFTNRLLLVLILGWLVKAGVDVSGILPFLH